jgi:predicted nucleic acid-binding protein
VLDSEAVSALAHPTERGSAAKRSQAVLEAIERRGGIARIPAPVLVEVARGSQRTAAVGRVIKTAKVTDTDRHIAERAGGLLEMLRLDSCHAVDALVVATAASLGTAIVLTGDPDDMRALAGLVTGVAVQPLS